MWQHFFKTEKRLLNPYIAKLAEYERYITYEQTMLHDRSGKWNLFFKTEKPLYVEIGSGSGNHVVRQAEKNPQVNFVACELRFKRLVSSARKAEKRSLKNLHFIRAYAQDLQKVFSAQEVDRIYIFFPEPWDDEKEEKRERLRVLSKTVLEEYRQFLKIGGEIIFKTDHSGYFEDVVNLFSTQDDFECLLLDRNFQTPSDERSEFEQMFIGQGVAIKSLIMKRRS